MHKIQYEFCHTEMVQILTAHTNAHQWKNEEPETGRASIQDSISNSKSGTDILISNSKSNGLIHAIHHREMNLLQFEY